METPRSQRWAHAVTFHWRWVLLLWVVAVVVLRWSAPGWEEIAYDGDFEYLPATMTSVAGGRLLDEAFPGERSRSQIVLVVGRESGDLISADDAVGLDLLRRLYHRLAEVSWQRAIEYGYETGPPTDTAQWSPWLKLARDALNQSIEIDERFYDVIADRVPEDAPTLRLPRMAIAYWDRAILLERWGEPAATVASDFEIAQALVYELPTLVTPIEKRDRRPWKSLIDVLSWEDTVVGRRLKHKGARLAVMQLHSELAATENIATVEAVQQMVDDVKSYSMRYTEPGLQVLMTGSAAIGGETLLAAKDAIRYTEWITVSMILLILAFVYRAPLLVAIPLISIGVAVVAATSLVSLLTRWSIDGTVPWLDMRVFTTSRIFVVVILFGAGTDYCLFLISRLREEAAKAPWNEACQNAMSGVMSALLGSAVTTIVGLGMLWIAQFGKFHYTGPIIAVCLLVGLFVCTTFTPALLRAVGPKVFWPATVQYHPSASSLMNPGDKSLARETVLAANQSVTKDDGLWGRVALILTRYPAVALVLGLSLLVVPGVYGILNEGSVTYDLSSQLSPSSTSRRGLKLMSDHFAIGEINPVTVLVVLPEAATHEELEKKVSELSDRLYTRHGVRRVRTADDPLGDFPPQRDMSLSSTDAWLRRALKNHRISQRYFYSDNPALKNRLARLDVTVAGDPFSVETAAMVSELETYLARQTEAVGSPWRGAKVLMAGTTPSIIDLRTVTLSDNRRIKIAVVMAVFAVLVIVLKRVGLCAYLIVTVLISYYATLGLTVLFFRGAYGADYVGLDWKLPLFLFVILVAVGQDYNVYLVTRIIEEQRRLGWLAAIRRAVARTGGIITACGLVMAATFFSMTASAWLPAVGEFTGLGFARQGTTLRGIVELGFALGLGVLIDTFYVRTILVPSFVAFMGKRRARA